MAAAFPETRTAVLARAAAGDWEQFFRDYLAACWRETRLACRARDLPCAEVDDVFQEMVVRLMKSGRSRRSDAPNEHGNHGNLPARFLRNRFQVGGPVSHKARFRTVLKRVIENLVLEELRRRRRAPRLLADGAEPVEPWLSESVSAIVEEQWLAACLTQSARRMMMESRAAATRGQRRLFSILHASLVLRKNAATLAQELGLDRTNVAGLLTQARRRLVAILQKTTGIESTSELKKLLARRPEMLPRALEAAHAAGLG
jgi:DNA-directed RNA polymerase specialized sigma24 family protein